MKCPFCSVFETKVIDSRNNQTGEITRRRRECLDCGGRFTTYERVEVTLPAVIKKDGRREAFNREKLKNGIEKACQKRPITTQKIDEIVSRIEKRLQGYGLREVPSRTLGEMIMSELHDLDKVAYIRFASVYRDFRDVEDFVENLRDYPESGDQTMTFSFEESPKESETTH